MTSQEYDRLKTDATRRAHMLRREAVNDFWDALARRIAHLTRLTHLTHFTQRRS